MKQMRTLNFGIQSMTRLGVGVFLGAAIALSAGALHPQHVAASCSDDYSGGGYCTVPPTLVSATITVAGIGAAPVGHVTILQNSQYDEAFSVCKYPADNRGAGNCGDDIDNVPGMGKTLTVDVTGLQPKSGYCFFIGASNPKSLNTLELTESNTVCASPVDTAPPSVTCAACGAQANHTISSTTLSTTPSTTTCIVCGSTDSTSQTNSSSAPAGTTIGSGSGAPSTSCAVCSQKPRLHPGD